MTDLEQAVRDALAENGGSVTKATPQLAGILAGGTYTLLILPDDIKLIEGIANYGTPIMGVSYHHFVNGDPLDHDHDGRKGGSLPKARRK